MSLTIVLTPKREIFSQHTHNNKLACKEIWFVNRLTWNLAKFLTYDVFKRPYVLHQAASCFSWFDIQDIAMHSSSAVHQQCIQMRPMYAGGIVVTRPPRMSGVRSSNPGTAIGYALLLRSKKKNSSPVLPSRLVRIRMNNCARTEVRLFKTTFFERLIWNPPESPFVMFFRQVNVLHQAASCFSRYNIRDIAIHVYLCSALLIRLLKIRRLPTTRFALLGSPGEAPTPGIPGKP
ncbi:hypothetical protein T265_00499 [Opisthorchis viverrini]|uniref:Uncharacterized protein n=1 Tax=Opisthorchis viverrini TaxID=6198 RepID=A0A075ACI5_OPIVI|nr:hypothetical protein T265_00499 [Opisthorchis viverrini]KER33605.1 hypothetical protein T265_00499 [Opisthorchis viverrini]